MIRPSSRRSRSSIPPVTACLIVIPDIALSYPQRAQNTVFIIALEGAARSAGLLLAPAEGFGLRPRPFFDLWAKQDLFMSVLAQILVIFGISSNLRNF